MDRLESRVTQFTIEIDLDSPHVWDMFVRYLLGENVYAEDK